MLLGGTLSLATAIWELSACGNSIPPPSTPSACESQTSSSSSTILVKFLYSTEKDTWLKHAIDAFQRKNQQYNGKTIQIVPQDSGSVDMVSQIVNNQCLDLIACFPASELELNRHDYPWKQKYCQTIINYTIDLAACRRERTSGHVGHSGSACVAHGADKSARTESGRRQNRVGDSDRMGWKEATVPALRRG